MNVVLLRPEEVDGAGRAVLEGRRFAHVRDVLGVRVGDNIRVGVMTGGRFAAEVVEMDGARCVIRLGEVLAALPTPSIDLLLALPRPKCLRRLLPQVAAMGVGRIFIVNAEKVERNYWGSHLLSATEYRPLLEEGLEQAGDTRLPVVRIVRRLKPFVEDEVRANYADGCKLVAHPARPCCSVAESTSRGVPATGQILLAVGPEGGWTEYELVLFEDNGFARLPLGSRILRTDTACIALLAVVGNGRKDG